VRDALFIARKDLSHRLRTRETILWMFFMPIIFFYFIGTVTGGTYSSMTGRPRIAVMMPKDAGFLGEQLVRRLDEQGLQVDRPATEAEFAEYYRRLRVPAAFTDSVLAGRQVILLWANDSEGLSRDFERIRVGRAVYTLLADVIAASETGQGPSPASLAALNAMPRMLRVAVEPAGERHRIPSGFEHAVPGIMTMFTLLVMTTGGSVLLVIERRQGMLRRLAATPMSRRSIVGGKWLGMLGMGVVQIGFAMLAGTVLFRMDWGPDLPMILALMLAYGAMMASLGLLLGCLARTENQAAGIGVLAANVLGALGGCWWPIEITPGWMQKFSLFLPTGWAMNALHKLISFRAGAASALPHLVGMILVAALVLAASRRAFRFE
jgi:ABC-2 type transport system permease protein